MFGSLRFKYILVVNLALVVPLGLYLLWDVHLERQSILDSRLEVLESLGHLVAEQTALSSTADPESLRVLLLHYGKQHADLEIHLLDETSSVVATTHPDWSGRRVAETEIDDVLQGRSEFAWDLDVHGALDVLEVTLPAPPVGALHIAEPQSTLVHQLRITRVRSSFFVLVLLVVLSATVTLATDRIVIRRIRRLSRRMSETGWNDASHPPYPRRDELEQLGDVLSSMLTEIERNTTELRRSLDERQRLLDRVEGFNEELAAQVHATRRELEQVQQDLLRKERLATVGELAAGLAHEIRNPLQIIQGTAEMVRRRHPEADADLADVVDEVRRLNQLVRDLLDYARPMAFEHQALDVRDTLTAALREAGLPRDGVEVDLQVPTGLSLRADSILIRRLLVNLLTNADEALREGQGRVEIRVDQDADGATRLEVIDDGEGIATEDLDRLFTPFFSRKEAGIGLGLCLCRRIAEQHGGTLEIDSVPGEGTTARLFLPGAEEE